MRRCCCSPNCTYFHAVPSAGADGQVSFADALDDELLLPLTGTWSVGTGGRLRVTGPGKIKINVPRPGSVPRMRLQAGTIPGFFPAINTSATLRYSVDYTDDNNRHYVEGHIRSGSFDPPETPGKIARVSGGSETVLWEKPINFWNNTLFGSTLTGTICVHDFGVRFSQGGADYSADDPIAAPTTAVGGLYAAIEVEQGESAVHEFDWVLLRKVDVPQCPVHDCDDCFVLPGCSRAPAGFVVGISGVADPTEPSYEFSGLAANFNTSIVVDEVDKYFYGTQFFESSPCYAPTATFAGGPFAFKSAVFELDPVVVYKDMSTTSTYEFEYTHGRVILIPLLVDNCEGPRFRLILQISQSAAFNNTCSKWLWVADMQPSTFSGNDVAGDCTALDGAIYSDNTATFPREEVQENIAFTVTAL